MYEWNCFHHKCTYGQFDNINQCNYFQLTQKLNCLKYKHNKAVSCYLMMTRVCCTIHRSIRRLYRRFMNRISFITTTTITKSFKLHSYIADAFRNLLFGFFLFSGSSLWWTIEHNFIIYFPHATHTANAFCWYTGMSCVQRKNIRCTSRISFKWRLSEVERFVVFGRALNLYAMHFTFKYIW